MHCCRSGGRNRRGSAFPPSPEGSRCVPAPGVCLPAKRDEFRLLTPTGSISLPTRPYLNNHGNFIVSLGLLTAWLGQQAENLGVDVFPGFAAAAPLFDEHGGVAGVQIGDMGLSKTGEPGPNY